MSKIDAVTLDHVTRTYLRDDFEVRALDDVTLRIPEHSFVAIMERSGPGKTTLLNLIIGIDYPTSGRVSVGGEEIAGMNESELAAWGFSPGGVEEFKKLRTACLVAEGTMKRFHLTVGQQIQLRGAGYYPFNVSLTIVGTIARGPAPSFLVFRRDYLEEIEGRPGRVDNFWVRADSSEAVPQIIQAVNSQFANSSAETQCDSEAAFLGSVIGRFRMFFVLAGVLGLIVVLTIGLVAVNAPAISIRERGNEIAVMRSIGFHSPLILRLLVVESVITTLTGCLLGCGAAFGLLKIFSGTSAVLGPFVGAVQSE